MTKKDFLAIREQARAVAYLLAVAFTTSPLLSIAHILVAAGAMLGGPLGAFGLKLLTDGLLAHEPGRLGWGLVVLLGAAAGGGILSALTTPLTARLAESARLEVMRREIDLAGGVETVEHLERPRFLDAIQQLQMAGFTLGSAPAVLPSVIGLTVQAAVTLALLGHVYPPLLLIALLAAPGLVMSSLNQRDNTRTWTRIGPHSRLASTLAWLLMQPRGAVEARIFGLSPVISKRIELESRVESRELDGLTVRDALRTLVSRLVLALGATLIVVVVARRAAAGQATVGDVIMVLSLFTQINYQLSGLTMQGSFLAQAVQAAEKLIWLRDFGASTRTSAGEAVPVPDHLEQGLTFDDVSFSYGEDGAEPALRNVSVHIPAGATVALVGENGAGKSTFVKLLTRMYPPTGGRILVDGIDLATLSPSEWRRQTSSAFQDFARFLLLVRENVGLGELASLEDEDRVLQAIADAEGEPLIAELPAGLDTQLGVSFGGAELSTGQWQRLALARAFMRRRPLLLVLDEPASAMDPEAENRLFERYSAAARSAAAETGGITILVSHRFSTVHMADMIAVLEQGRVTQVGTHEDLVVAPGLYKELYELQAKAYQ